MGRLFLITVLLVIYGSLYPFSFHPLGVASSPLWFLFHSWPESLDYSLLRDLVLNLLLYVPVGIFGSLWIGKGKVSARAAVWTILLGTSLSASMELLQAYDYSRYCGLTDLLANALGSATGVLLAYVYGRTIGKLGRPEVQAGLDPSGALLLLLFWAAYQSFPLIPSFSRYGVTMKLESLWSSRAFSPVETLGVVIEWLVVARLIEAIAGVRAARKALPIALLLLPARLVIAGRSLVWPELIGAFCAWVVWTLWLRSLERRTLLLAWLAAALLLVRGLAPYHFQAAPAQFSWTPFGSSLGQQGPGMIPFSHKGFLYGTAVWLLHEAGFGYTRPAIGLALLLGAIEAVQRYLPGRTPEISDPIYVVLLAIVLKLLETWDRKRSPRLAGDPPPA